MKVIDVHHHYVPEVLGRRLGYVPGEVCHVVRNGQRIMSIHDRMVDLDSQVAEMDAAAVDTAVLSSFLGWDADADECRLVNDDLRRQKDVHGDRFDAYAHLPTQDMPAALAELDRCVDELGFRALTVMNQVDGRTLDDPSLDPLYARVEELGLPIFVHPVLYCSDHAGATDFGLDRVIGREFDLMTSVSRVVAGGVLDRFPELKLIFSHFGGGISGIYDRIMSKGYRFEDGLQHRFEDYFKRMYFDTAGFEGGSNALRSALLVIPPQQLMFGTDYPQDFTGVMTGRGAGVGGIREYVDRIVDTVGVYEDSERILSRNYLDLVNAVGVR